MDAFLDTVRYPNGQPLDPRFNQTFACLQTTGQFCTQTTSTPTPDPPRGRRGSHH